MGGAMLVGGKRLFGVLAVSNEVALPQTTWSMARNEELLLAITLGVWVLAASSLRALFSLRLRWIPGGSGRTLRAVLFVEEWAMLDVFGLGLMIVWVKLDELTTTTLRVGFWLTLLAAVLAALDSWQLRRALRANQVSFRDAVGGL